MGRLASYGQISCAVNPACGREADYGLTPASEKKSVMIVGGGIGGHVQALMPPGARAPEGAREVRPGEGGRLLD